MTQQRSNLTLEVFPTIQELAKTMLTYFLNEGGHGELFDACKVLFSTNHEEIAKAFIFTAEEMNDEEMKLAGLCPECGSELVYKNALEVYSCTNQACAMSYTRRAC